MSEYTEVERPFLAQQAITHKPGLRVGARSFTGNPCDGHTLAARLEQTNTLLQDIGTMPTTAIVDLGYRGVDAQVAPVQGVHRGKYKAPHWPATPLAQPQGPLVAARRCRRRAARAEPRGGLRHPLLAWTEMPTGVIARVLGAGRCRHFRPDPGAVSAPAPGPCAGAVAMTASTDRKPAEVPRPAPERAPEPCSSSRRGIREECCR